MQFDFSTSDRIVFGFGKLDSLGTILQSMTPIPTHCMIVTGKDTSRCTNLLLPLLDQCTPPIQHTIFSVSHEPTTLDASSATAQARAAGCDSVIAFGGGSALDLGKAVAGLLSNGGEPLDYIEVIGRGQKITRTAVPMVAVPTTSGTGSEVTRNAVLRSPEHRVKVSMRSPLLIPCVALVDPQLTLSLPPDMTAYSGMDALTQILEPYTCCAPTVLTDALCLDAIPRACRALPTAFRDPACRDAREQMSYVSLVGGIALANAKLGAVHGIAGPLGGMTGAPHGAVCARLLPFVTEANIRLAQGHVRERYRRVARVVTEDDAAEPEALTAHLMRLVAELGIPPLSRWGLTAEQIPALVQKARAASSMKGNPVVLDETAIEDIVRRAL